MEPLIAHGQMGLSPEHPFAFCSAELVWPPRGSSDDRRSTMAWAESSPSRAANIPLGFHGPRIDAHEPGRRGVAVGQAGGSGGFMDYESTERVLVVLDAGAGSRPALVTGESLPGRRHFQLEVIQPDKLADLQDRLADLIPHVLLIDVGWLGRFDAEDIARLRRAHGATSWVLAGAGEAESQVDLLIRCQACGYLEWRVDPAVFVRAMKAVLRGEYWFARGVMQRLYESLLVAGPPPPVQGDDNLLSRLSPRVAESLTLMRQGLTNKQIAVRLGVSVNTVKKHLAHAYVKIGLHSRRQSLG